MFRASCLAAALLCLVPPAFAHHGGGTFDNTKEIKLTGKLTKFDFINPHSWIYFDVAGNDGKVARFRCETRAATVLRRSGWKPEMFRLGQTIVIEGQPDRNDPNSCYLNTLVLEDGSRADRYGQFSKGAAPSVARTRAPRRPSGEPNISGDWAPEQLVMTDPRGRGGALVPLSTVSNFKPGEGRIGGSTGRGTGPRLYGGSELTTLGEQAAANFGTFAVKDNPRMRCETTSIIFDWTFDGPVNRITQNRNTIVLQYGQLGLTRTVHMNMAAHPAGIKATRAGHSIGRWEKDVLIVDTIGFLPGVLNPPVLNSDKLHVVERFTLDPEKRELRRSYEADDPVYLKGKYSGSDAIAMADLPYQPDPCKELGFVDYSKTAK